VAKDISADSILLLGDNFYSEGVDDVDSKRFKQTFENVYSSELFGDLPFHVIAGNHDHYGNVQAQIDYSKTSSHWNFPSLYYSLDWQWTADSGEPRSAQILMIDTVDLAGISVDGSRLPLAGPQNLTCAANQWSWIEKQLKASTADFLWVAGHYPIYSAGDDGTTQELVDQLLPMLKKYGAHYICGHDHLVQHLDMDGVQSFQNGMGRECCYGLDDLDSVPTQYIKYLISGNHAQGTHMGAGSKPSKVLGGFNTMEFGDDDVTITAHREDGSELYSAQVARRSTSTIV
jgi:3',5'-cyclic AMP phosphodiesterase CpdA